MANVAPKFVGLSDVTPNHGTVVYCGASELDAQDACEAAGGPGGTRVLREHPQSCEEIEIGKRAYQDGEFAWLKCGYEVSVTALPADAVIVETMPGHLRESHRDAGNWGQYPHNGAERQIMARADAQELVSADSDEYNRIVRAAVDADLANYEVAS